MARLGNPARATALYGRGKRLAAVGLGRIPSRHNNYVLLLLAQSETERLWRGGSPCRMTSAARARLEAARLAVEGLLWVAEATGFGGPEGSDRDAVVSQILAPTGMIPGQSSNDEGDS